MIPQHQFLAPIDHFFPVLTKDHLFVAPTLQLLSHPVLDRDHHFSPNHRLVEEALAHGVPLNETFDDLVCLGDLELVEPRPKNLRAFNHCLEDELVADALADVSKLLDLLSVPEHGMFLEPEDCIRCLFMPPLLLCQRSLVQSAKEKALQLPDCLVSHGVQLLRHSDRVHPIRNQFDGFLDDYNSDPLESPPLTLAPLLLNFILSVHDKLLDHGSVRLIHLVLVLIDVLVELAELGGVLHFLPLLHFQLFLHFALPLRHPQLDLVSLDEVLIFTIVGPH